MYTIVMNTAVARDIVEREFIKEHPDVPYEPKALKLKLLSRINGYIEDAIPTWLEHVNNNTLNQYYAKELDGEDYWLAELLYELFTFYIPPTHEVLIRIRDGHGNVDIIVEE